jgi:ubiquinone biosynthesis protein
MRRLLVTAWLLLCTPVLRAEIEFTVSVPTPLEHYKSYDVDTASLELMSQVMQKLNPEQRAMAMELLQSGKTPGDLPPLDPKEAFKLIDELGLREFKPQLLEVFLHKSQVLDVVPEEYHESVLPILHDALLAFIDGLSDERIAERVVAMSRIPPDADRGEKVLILASKIPTLQKVGQIVARVEAIPPDVREALQTLESGISTMTRDELVAEIEESVGSEVIEKYQIEFADKVLAEASVGAVIRCSFIEPGATEREDMVAKLIKAYVRTGLPQELKIMSALIELVAENAQFYHVEKIPIRELFEQVKDKLDEELLVTQEQANFKRAYEFYQGHKYIRVPEIQPFSTENVTFMDFFHGEKITDAFPGDTQKRAELYRVLADAMTYETLFSKPATSVFHGDPHAGNVMHITDDPDQPYLIGLIDWGLLGNFEREERIEMMQLSLATKWKDVNRLRKNVGALLDQGLPTDPEKLEEINALVEQCMAEHGADTMGALGSLVTHLTTKGYVLNPDLTLFIKSQLTLAGIFRELDPNTKLDKYIENRVSGQVKKEIPKRLLLLPAVKYRGYRSLMTTPEVFKAAGK